MILLPKNVLFVHQVTSQVRYVVMIISTIKMELVLIYQALINHGVKTVNRSLMMTYLKKLVVHVTLVLLCKMVSVVQRNLISMEYVMKQL